MNIKVVPKVGEIGALHMPAFRDKHGHAVVLMSIGKIESVVNDMIKIEGISLSVPLYRMEWYTFGGIAIQNKKFNLTRVRNENTMILNKRK